MIDLGNTKREVEDRITMIEMEIKNHKYWLSDGRTSNPIVMKRRKKQLNIAERKLIELKSRLKLF